MRARRYGLIVFDWDGTLMDSAGVIADSIRAACADLGIPVPSDAEARHIIGLGLQEAIAALLPALPVQDYPRLAERYRRHFLGRDHEIPLFEGVREIVTNLHDRGHMLGVATGKSRRGLERVLDHTGLGQYFHASRCADECHSKPHPAMILELMDAFGIKPSDTLMIGDTSHDGEMAANAGVDFLAVSYGAHPRELLTAYPALACCHTPSELRRWLLANA
jgi:phosphoglycolate phosphatase